MKSLAFITAIFCAVFFPVSDPLAGVLVWMLCARMHYQRLKPLLKPAPTPEEQQAEDDLVDRGLFKLEAERMPITITEEHLPRVLH